VFKRHLAVTLSVIITGLSFSAAIATAQSTAEIEKIRARVQTLSTSKDSQVEVKFRDRTKIKGYIDRVEPLSFTLRNAKDGTSQSITYSEVDSVSKAGGGISTKTWLILGGVAAGAVTTWLVVKPAVCDGGAQTRGIC
jgi:hypothetical protein